MVKIGTERRHIYVVKMFDLANWSAREAVAAFETEDEARYFCDTVTRTGRDYYTYDKVLIGSYPEIRSGEVRVPQERTWIWPPREG